MTEILFYHLQRQPLERVLPLLLEKTLERDWKAVIRCGSAERLAALDDLLWTWRDISFLPHGTHIEGNRAGDKTGANQPIYLTLQNERPNEAEVLFLVDGAPLNDETLKNAPYTRIVLMFDGNDDAQLNDARASWKQVTALSLTATYWQQDENDKWVKKA
jgi:DNA polymerase III subunit chi